VTGGETGICRVVPRALLEGVYGTKLTINTDDAKYYAGLGMNCTYSNNQVLQGTLVALIMNVFQDPTKKEFDSRKRLSAGPEVSGLGDAAIYMGQGALVVTQGGITLLISVYAGPKLVSKRDESSMALELARAALAHPDLRTLVLG
jgi:hypothetical protein